LLKEEGLPGNRKPRKKRRRGPKRKRGELELLREKKGKILDFSQSN